MPELGAALCDSRRRRRGVGPAVVIRPGATVGVVGGGLLGLTAALRLAEAGVQVTVFEAASELGGLASAWSIPTPDGPVEWDRYYHVTLASDEALRALLRDLRPGRRGALDHDQDGLLRRGETLAGVDAEGVPRASGVVARREAPARRDDRTRGHGARLACPRTHVGRTLVDPMVRCRHVPSLLDSAPRSEAR